MKRQVQHLGIKKWTADDLLDLQQQPLEVIDGFFEQFGNLIIKGCEVDFEIGAIAPGIVGLAGLDPADKATYKVAPFAGAVDVKAWPAYLVLERTTVERPYVDGVMRPVAHVYSAVLSQDKPADDMPCLEIGGEHDARFLDAIQDARHRFLTQQQIDNLLLPPPPTGDGYMAVNDPKAGVRWESADGNKVGEIITLSAVQSINDERYLHCDGSQIDPIDYPDLNLPRRLLSFKAHALPVNGIHSHLHIARVGDFMLAIGVGNNSGIAAARVGQEWSVVAIPSIFSGFTVRGLVFFAEKFYLLGVNQNTSPMQWRLLESSDWGATWRLNSEWTSSYIGGYGLLTILDEQLVAFTGNEVRVSFNPPLWEIKTAAENWDNNTKVIKANGIYMRWRSDRAESSTDLLTWRIVDSDAIGLSFVEGFFFISKRDGIIKTADGLSLPKVTTTLTRKVGAAGDYYYAYDHNGTTALYSTDKGATWHPVVSASPITFVTAVAYLAGTYYLFNGRTFKSADGINFSLVDGVTYDGAEPDVFIDANNSFVIFTRTGYYEADAPHVLPDLTTIETKSYIKALK